MRQSQAKDGKYIGYTTTTRRGVRAVPPRHRAQYFPSFGEARKYLIACLRGKHEPRQAVFF